MKNAFYRFTPNPVKQFCPFFLAFSILFSSCEDEPVPAYLNFSSITVNAKPGEGSSSSNISDVWVFQNFNLQGAYELPVEFPILAEGNTRLLVYAGIKLNGISTTRAMYPFYDADTIDAHLTPAQADTFYPSVRYSRNAVFDFIESFENANNFTHIQRISGSDVFEGNFSGKLDADSVEIIALTNSSYAIPYNTTAAFLEMDYKNNHLFEVGIVALSGAQTYSLYKLTVPPRNEWNKLYINFTPEVNSLQAESYQIYFRLVPTLDANAIELFFDNVKLIHAQV